MVRLRDIADDVGLSVSAVSMALTDHPRISEKAKKRVREAAAELGYVANAAGRALRSKRAETIALAVPNTSAHVFGHQYFMHLLEGVTQVAAEHAAHVLVSTNAANADRSGAYDRVLRSGAADGVIVTSAAVGDPDFQHLVETGLPVVLLGSYTGPTPVDSVGVDNVSAARAATEHLILTHGLRRLLHLSGPLDHQEALDRRQGFLGACREHDVLGDVLEGDFTEASARALVAPIAGLMDYDGIFAANDDLAFGAITELKAAGVQVPADVAVVGFDDFGLSRVTTPSISTIAVPACDMAVAAARRLFAVIGDSTAARDVEHELVPVQFVARQSCGCLPL